MSVLSGYGDERSLRTGESIGGFWWLAENNGQAGGLTYGVWDDGAGLFGEVIPAVDMVPSANFRQPGLADRRHAVPVNSGEPPGKEPNLFVPCALNQFVRVF